MSFDVINGGGFSREGVFFKIACISLVDDFRLNVLFRYKPAGFLVVLFKSQFIWDANDGIDPEAGSHRNNIFGFIHDWMHFNF